MSSDPPASLVAVVALDQPAVRPVAVVLALEPERGQALA